MLMFKFLFHLQESLASQKLDFIFVTDCGFLKIGFFFCVNDLSSQKCLHELIFYNYLEQYGLKDILTESTTSL